MTDIEITYTGQTKDLGKLLWECTDCNFGPCIKEQKYDPNGYCNRSNYRMHTKFICVCEISDPIYSMQQVSHFKEYK